MASTSQKKTRRTDASPSKGKRSAQRPPIRREVWGLTLAALALFVLISYANISALFIDYLALLLKGLVGYGYWLCAPALALGSFILLTHRGRPVRLRLGCALLLPVIFGILGHMLACTETFDASAAILRDLWRTGTDLHSGGAISGALAMGFVAVFSKVASVVLFLAVFVGLAMAALRLSPAALLERHRQRPRYEERPVERVERKAPPVPERQHRGERPQIDIPLDGEERSAEAPPRSGRFTGFFRHKSDQLKTPDQLLAEERVKKPKIIPPAIPQERPEPVAPVVTAEPPRKEVTPQAAQPMAEEPPTFAQEALPRDEGETPVGIVEAARPAEPVRPAETVRSQEQPRAQEMEAGKKEKLNTAQEVARQTAAVTAEIEEKLLAEGDEYQFPPITLLEENRSDNHVVVGEELRKNSSRLAETLSSFGVNATAADVVHGPSVTRYEFVLDQGVKLNKITNLADDIALALGATGVRIAPIPDKISVVGIEVPNKHVTPVLIRDVIESRDFAEHSSKVAFALGRDIAGKNVIGNIEKLPHVLIAGTTGSGKSVCTNSLIISMLYKSTPDEVRFIMVDPKMVELAPYNGIPHLLIPVVTDPKKAAGALQWAVFEMMKRYKTFSEHGVKKLEEFNRLARNSEELETMPSVVVVIDELADLMLVAAKEVEESICRVAQMGRAAGVHLVIATQRPSADVITGLMKANIPSRIAFAVASSLESRIILDNTGAEKLVGKGDMLYAPLGAGKPMRVQGCFISPEEIEEVVRFVKQSGEAQYSDEVIAKIEESIQEKDKGGGKGAPSPQETGGDESDELLPAAVDVVLETGQASVSMLQRRLKLGYSRAARLVDQMEERGIVGPFEGSKPRQLLITRAQWQELQMGGEPPFDEGADGSETGEDPADY